MMRVALLLLVVAVAQAVNPLPPPCFAQCRFSMCGPAVLPVGKPDTPLSANVCRRDDGASVGIINTGEARVVLDGRRLIPVSQWQPPKLEQRFASSFFKAFIVPGPRSAVGHQTPQQNQADFIVGRCFALPIITYQLLDADGNVVDNNFGNGEPMRNCVSFVVLSAPGEHTLLPAASDSPLPTPSPSQSAAPSAPPRSPSDTPTASSSSLTEPRASPSSSSSASVPPTYSPFEVPYTPEPTESPSYSASASPSSSSSASVPPTYSPVEVPYTPEPTESPSYSASASPSSSSSASVSPTYSPVEVPYTPEPSESPSYSASASQLVGPSISAVAPTPSAAPSVSASASYAPVIETTVSPSTSSAPLASASPINATASPAATPFCIPAKSGNSTGKMMKMMGPWSGPTLKEEVHLGASNLTAQASFMKELIIGKTSSVKEDLYLLIDATESMQVAIDTVQQQIDKIIANRLAGSSDAAFGVGYFRDEDEAERGFRNLQSITRNATAVRDATLALVASGGGDAPEGGLQALYRIANDEVSWRNDSRRIVAMFGDHPQHEPSCIRGNRLDRDNVVAALRARGVKVVMVDVSGLGANQGLNGRPTQFKCRGNVTAGGTGQGLDIASRTGGAFLENPNQDQVVREIVRAIGALDLEVDADLSDCDGMYDVTLAPKMPTRIKQGYRLTLKETIAVHPRVCESTRGYTCTIRFTADGGQLASQVIGSTDISNCKGKVSPTPVPICRS